MSFYSDASLVMIPSGYKTSKVYSAVPTSGDGDLVFSRSNDTATRVGPDGLIEKVRTNLILQSQTFDNASWVKDGATITDNATTAPDGTTTAEKILETATTAAHNIYQVPTVSSNIYSISFFVKKAERFKVAIADRNTGGYVAFNLNTGVIIESLVFSGKIQSLANDWYRLTITSASAVAIINPQLFILSDSYTTGVPATTPYAGNATSGLFIWGAQLEVSDFGATDYILTTTAAVSVGPVANVPRLDYLNSSCPRLLLEPQRSNLALYSEQINTGFAASQGGTGIAPVITANNAISPDGYQNADTIVFDAGAGTTSSDQSALYQFFGGTTATYTASFYAKTPSGTAQIQVRIDGSSYEKFTITNQWQRFTLTRALTGTGNGIDIAIRRGLNEPMNASATIQLWGVQVELGAYATSYIPTLGASVTRGADVAEKTGISSLIGQTVGTVFVEFEFSGSKDSFWPVMTVMGASSAELIEIYGSAGSNAVGVYMLDGGTAQFSRTIALTVGSHKLAIAYELNNTVAYLDGTVIGGVDTSCTIPTMTQIALGKFAYSSAYTYGDRIDQAILFPVRLSDSDLAALTA